jgi:two-component system, LytTR family, response regulator
MIRALIVDDEPVARRRIKRLLGSEDGFAIAGECGDGEEAIAVLEGGSVDLVFLDVQMPGTHGFDVVRRVGDAMPAVVFVTAFDQYALAAFEVHAFDYLLKPFSRARFEECVRRARTELEGRRRGAATDQRMTALVQELRGRRYLSRFVIREGGRVLLLDCARVDWIEAADNYAILHAGASTYAIRETLTKLAEDLDPQHFVRVHRSAMVRIDRVRELQPAFHGDFVISLHDGTRVAMSRSYRAAVEAVLGRGL